MACILRLIEAGADGQCQCIDVLKIVRPDDLGEIGNLGLTLTEAKLLLAAVQQEVVAAQARDHAVRRPDCRSCGAACQVKDYFDKVTLDTSGSSHAMLKYTWKLQNIFCDSYINAHDITAIKIAFRYQPYLACTEFRLDD